MALLLLLDDDPARLAGFQASLPALGSEWHLKTWTRAEDMIAGLDESLAQAQFIALDAGLAPPVVERMAKLAPSCPVTLHWRNRTHDTAWRAFKQLSASGWDLQTVQYFGEGRGQNWVLDWLRSWREVAQALLLARTDRRVNQLHAANCERLRAQFEGREAIYFEKYVRSEE